MNSFSPFFSADGSYDEVLPWLKQQLSGAGLRVMQTFDLRLTPSVQAGQYTCPHHGTDQCDCQMVVLLVYSNVPEPATLILHGNDGHTWLSLVDQPAHHADTKIVSTVQQALEIHESDGT